MPYRYLLLHLNHLFSFQKVPCFFSSPAEIIDTKVLQFFYCSLKFLDLYIHIHHHRIYYFFVFLSYHFHRYHFQIILIIHHFQRDPHLLHHSNHHLLLHNHLPIFLYFSYPFCRVDCPFRIIYFIFYRFLIWKDVYFFLLVHSYCPCRNGPQTHQIHVYQKSSHQGRRMSHLANCKSPCYQNIHQEL